MTAQLPPQALPKQYSASVRLISPRKSKSGKYIEDERRFSRIEISAYRFDTSYFRAAGGGPAFLG